MYMLSYEVDDSVVKAQIRCDCGCEFDAEFDVWNMLNTWKGLSCARCGREQSGRSLYAKWYADSHRVEAILVS